MFFFGSARGKPSVRHKVGSPAGFLAVVCAVCLGATPGPAAQENPVNGGVLSFPSRRAGIGIGNSREFTGLRVNWADHDVKRINGLNITFWLTRSNQEATVNGISLGVIPTAGTLRGVHVGVLGAGGAHHVSGLTLGGVVVGAGGNISGLSAGGLLLMADGPRSSVSGIAFSGLGLGAKKSINGLAVAGLALGTDGTVNGVVSSLLYVSAGERIRGVAVTGGWLTADAFGGVSLAGYARFNRMHGISLALVNSTDCLHGIQVGLLNIARNNPRGLKCLPFMNLNLCGE